VLFYRNVAILFLSYAPSLTFKHSDPIASKLLRSAAICYERTVLLLVLLPSDTFPTGLR
jgi:hypothetical protein